MDNNILKYKAFIETVETGSFTKAAAALNYSQSSISKMIADLEKEWNVTLLERDRNGIHITSSGEQLLPYARLLIDDYESMQSYINDLNGIRTGHIRIGTFSSVAINWLPNIFTKFRADFPNIEYELFLGDYEEIEKRIDDKSLDCGFLRLPTKRNLYTISLKKDEYVVIIPKDHPLCACETVDIQDLENIPFILLENGGKTEVSYILEKYNVHPDIIFTTWEDFAVMAMVERGIGAAILPRMILSRIPYDIVIRPLKNPYFREIGIAFKNKNRLSPVTKKFCEYLKYREQNDII